MEKDEEKITKKTSIFWGVDEERGWKKIDGGGLVLSRKDKSWDKKSENGW